jgi:hypothetical protein
MASFPASLVLGILGIVLDRSKVLAIITTIVASGLVAFWLFMMLRQTVLSCSG